LIDETATTEVGPHPTKPQRKRRINIVTRNGTGEILIVRVFVLDYNTFNLSANLSHRFRKPDCHNIEPRTGLCGGKVVNEEEKTQTLNDIDSQEHNAV